MKQEQIVEYIKKIYNPSAIVLAGSRASENYTEGSDWDFYVFTNESYKIEAEQFDGEVLDITLVESPIPSEFIFDTKYHPEQYLKVIYKTEGTVVELVEKTIELYKAGPTKLTEDEKRILKKILERYIHKAETRKDTSFYYLSLFYQISLRVWFQLKNLWPLSPHEALEHIKFKDPEFHALLETISGNADSVHQTKAAKEILVRLF